jgi:hypothetical protein
MSAITTRDTANLKPRNYDVNYENTPPQISRSERPPRYQHSPAGHESIRSHIPSTEGVSRYQHSPSGYVCHPIQISRSERPTDSMDGGNVHTIIHRSCRPYKRLAPFHSPAGYAGMGTHLRCWVRTDHAFTSIWFCGFGKLNSRLR